VSGRGTPKVFKRARVRGVVFDRSLVAAVFLVAIAVALRTAFLGDRQLFRDEAASWLLAQYPLSQLISHAAAEPYPPLYALILKWWLQIAGDSEVALRSLSVISGLAMVLVGWRWASESLGRRAGLIALALLAISPLAIANARDVRMYALEAAWTTLGWWLTWRLASGRSSARRRAIDAAALALAVAAEVWTFSFGLPVAALQFAVAAMAWLRHRRTENALAPAVIVAGGATFLPWLPTVVANVGGRPFWTPIPQLDDLGSAFTLMIGGWGLPWVLASSIVLLVAGAGVLVLTTGRVTVMGRAGAEAPRTQVLALAVAAGLALVPVVWIYSHFHSFYDSRYFGACVAPLAIAAAAGSCWALARIGPKIARAVLGTGLAILLLGGTLTWLGGWRAEVGLAPARQLLALLEEEMRPGDIALSLDARSYFQIAYLLGHHGTADHLPGPFFNWSSGSEPFFYGQSLISSNVSVPTSEAGTVGWTASLPGLAAGGRIWLIALANGSDESLGFRPLEEGQLAEVSRTVLEPVGEAGQLLELIVLGR
jgi:4-amino-4-deoxy-L-arabinose transferase-like glycosyltransferase